MKSAMSATRPTAPKPARDAAAPRDAASRARLFASVMASAKDAVLVTEAEPVDLPSGGPRIIYVNEAFTAMTGYTAEDAVGQTPRMLQSPRTDQRELDRLRRALRRWESVEVELLNVDKHGREFWVQFIIAPVADDDGWYTHWVSIQRDVTARRRRDEELAEIVRASRDVVAVVSFDGTIRTASRTAEAVLGSAGGALVDSQATDLLRPGQRPGGIAVLQAARDPESRDTKRELELATPAGYRWFEVTARLASLDEDAGSIVVTATDVTERRRERAALRLAQQRFRGAFAAAPIGMAVVARDGSVLDANAQLARLVGRDEEALAATSISALVHPEDREASEAEREGIFGGTLEVSRRETRMLHADGRVVGTMFSTSIVRRTADSAELVVHVEDISERKALQARLTHQALHDDLTHLPNRALFLDRLQVALERRRLHGSPVCVLFLDLDRFKAVNDSFGHATGDLVLTTVADRLAALTAPGDTAARFAGDEFTILCDGTDADGAVALAERIAASIEAPITLPRHGRIFLRASIGIAPAVAPTATADALLRDADMAMYAAKEHEELRWQVFDARLRSRSLARLDEEQDLAVAIAADELELWYQPLFRADADADAIEFEALVRWRHPKRGLLAPAAFVPLAEESGLIADLDRWVLGRACRDVAELAVAGARVWVNLSLRTLGESWLPEHVTASLVANGLDAGSLGIEITERAVVDGPEGTSEAIAALRERGVALAADDFGTGYSSLSALIERPVDVLKIDRSFVSGLPSPESTAVVRAIVAMAAALGLRTVAEGIETVEQLHAVRDLGCGHVQGYLLGRPMPLADVQGRRPAALAIPVA